jgi:hypothetical protein
LLSITAPPNLGAVQPQPELWTAAALAWVGSDAGALAGAGAGALARMSIGAGARACTGIGRSADEADALVFPAVSAGSRGGPTGAEAVAGVGGAARATRGRDGCSARLRRGGGRVALMLAEPATKSGAARGQRRREAGGRGPQNGQAGAGGSRRTIDRPKDVVGRALDEFVQVFQCS